MCLGNCGPNARDACPKRPTCQDSLSEYLVAVPIKQQDADSATRTLVEHVVLVFGIPQCILPDQGSNFMSEVTDVPLLQFKRICTSSYHPQSNFVEGSYRTLAEYLQHYISQDQDDWDRWIPNATFVFSITPHCNRSTSPHTLTPNILCTLQKEPMGLNEEYDDKKQYKKKANKYRIAEEDEVIMYDESVHKGRSRKFASQWVGPFEVIKVEG
ncbi:hypothetical protein PR048_009252 [Dryococelus australis]|uniref:Integrase catalytic domain-containing protein n=1 Tax=Dryococelus australis TaxID=614101 RepID=A0ABQ9HZD3_9NEOP|nr:hypothetical protein PR048_009252 [Dryococelus australis]